MRYRTTCFTVLRAGGLGVFVALALVCLWPHASAAQGALPVKWIYAPMTEVDGVAYSPDGTRLALVGVYHGKDPIVQIHTVAGRAVICLPTSANEAVHAVAFSPDGKTLAVGGLRHRYSLDLATVAYTGVLELWNVSTGKRIAALDTAANSSGAALLVTGGVQSVAFSPDGTTLADGGYSGTASSAGSVVELWDVATRQRTAMLSTAANAGISSVAFSPDGSTLADGGVSVNTATGANSGVLELWSLSGNNLLESLGTAANTGVRSVAFSPDGKTLAASGQNYNVATGVSSGVLELWSVATSALTKSLGTAAASGVNGVAFSPDGSTLAAGGSSGAAGQSSTVLELWSVPGGTRITKLSAADLVHAVAFSPDGKTLADGGVLNVGEYGVAHRWNVSTGTLLETVNTVAIGNVQSIAFSPDGKTLASTEGGYDSLGKYFTAINLRSISTGVLLTSLPTAANDFAPSVAFSPDGNTLAIGGTNYTETPTGPTYKGVLELWNVSTGKRIASLPTAANGIVKSVAFSPNGRRLAIGGANSIPGLVPSPVLEMWNVSTATLITSQTRSDPGGGYTSVVFSPDGATLGVGGFGGTLEIWDVGRAVRTASIKTAADGAVYAVAFSPDGRTLAAGGALRATRAAVLELWDLPTGARRASPAPVPGDYKVSSLAFAPRGNVLFVGTDANLQIFNTVTGGLLSYDFQYTNSDGPESIAVSRDGRLLAYGTGTGTLAIAPAPYSRTFLDFNGDGLTDLLLQNATTGAIAAWYMNGGSQAGSAPFSLSPSPDYALVGVGDFAGDGTAALVLQNRADDTIALWYTGGLNSTLITGADYIRPNPLPGWKVVGVGDFNGDGKSDLVFQNRTTNQIVIWFMDGPVYQGGARLPYTPPADWQVVGTGDFNGDGYADLVFQNQTSGQIVVWYMNGVTYLGGTALANVPDPGWRVVGIGDYNQDGSPDLLLQNRTTNQAAVWYFQNSMLQGSAGLSAIPPPGWQIVGPR